MARKADGESVEKKAVKPRKATATRRKLPQTSEATAKAVERAALLPCTEEQIRERAYFIYLERGGAPGDSMADWFQAKRELTCGATAARE